MLYYFPKINIRYDIIISTNGTIIDHNKIIIIHLKQNNNKNSNINNSNHE